MDYRCAVGEANYRGVYTVKQPLEEQRNFTSSSTEDFRVALQAEHTGQRGVLLLLNRVDLELFLATPRRSSMHHVEVSWYIGTSLTKAIGMYRSNEVIQDAGTLQHHRM